MRSKFISTTGLFLISVFFLMFMFTFLKSVIAQSCSTSPLHEGLISAISIPGYTFGNLGGTCVLDPNASYRDFKVPDYQGLEDQFYNLSRSAFKKAAPPNNLSFIGGNSGDGIYLVTGDLTIDASNSPSGVGTQIIFIRGKLDINTDITYAETGNPSNDSISGLVFVVQGDINIHQNVTRVNAILVSTGVEPPDPNIGIICTAYNGGCLDGTTTTPQLTINGSLISLNKADLGAESAIRLRRSLLINTQPAEIIKKQAKYLYNLRNSLFTKDLTIITEDQKYNIAGGTPDDPPPPPPPPSTCGSSSGNPAVIPPDKTIPDCLTI